MRIGSSRRIQQYYPTVCMSSLRVRVSYQASLTVNYIFMMSYRPTDGTVQQSEVVDEG